MYSCQCHQIGGPFIAEDPDCPYHQRGGAQDQIEVLESRVHELEQLALKQGWAFPEA